MTWLEWLDATVAAQYMRESFWGYPIALTVHAIGMGLLVGILAIVDLRLLGMFRRLPLSSLPGLLKIAALGFAANFVSGSLMFVSDPIVYAANIAFLSKLVLVIVGMALAVCVRWTPEYRHMWYLRPEAAGGSAARALAGASLLVWGGAIVAGRLIGYLL